MPTFRTVKIRLIARCLAGRRTLTAATVATAGAAVLVAGPAAGAVVPSAGSPWSRQSTPNVVMPNGHLLGDSCASASSCVAVGESATSAGTSPLAEEWNGTGWHILSTPGVQHGTTRGVLDAVSCTSASACMAVGHDIASSGHQLALAESWNGTSWTVLATPDPDQATQVSLDSVSCAAATSCVATGSYGYGGDNSNTVLAGQWNGRTWTLRQAAVPKGADLSVLNGVSCESVTDCTAVGEYFPYSTTDWLTLAEVWNGSTWKIQPSPTTSGAAVTVLSSVSCMSAASCMAVGDATTFTKTGAELIITVAEAWNGSAWKIVPTPNAANDAISSLSSLSCTAADACTAAGYSSPSFHRADHALAEAWNGTAWAIKATPTGASQGLSGVSCAAAAACAAVGYTTESLGTALALAERWDGTAWAVTPAPSPPGARSSVVYGGVSCTSADSCTGVGFYNATPRSTGTLAEHWNGTAWQIQPTPDVPHISYSQLYGVSCGSPAACVAVGQAYDNADTATPLAEQWNGKTWAAAQRIPIPAGAKYAELEAVSCTSATACTAVGDYTTPTELAYPLADRWNGSTWTVQAMPKPTGGLGDELLGVSCSSATACTAVGYYSTTSTDHTLAERWNGTAWTIQATPYKIGGGRNADVLYGVSCPTATTCTAVGDSYNFPAGLAPLAEVWQDGTWQVQPTVNPPDSFYKILLGVSCTSPTNCRAVGQDVTSAGVSLPLAEAWNGTAWTQQAVPSNPADYTVLGGLSDHPGGTGFTAMGYATSVAKVSATLAEVSP